MTRIVPIAEADCAAPRARSNDGSAIVHSVQISDAVNNRSMSVKPDSPRDETALLIAMTHQGHFSALLPFFDRPKLAVLPILAAFTFP
jgi:hypothetical protein